MSRAAVQVVAHRGASEVVAEHTLGAYETAVASGADALEADVRLTRDGVLVCVHDRRVNRVSDGRGAVSALELADLADLDFASWKDRARAPGANALATLGIRAGAGARSDAAGPPVPTGTEADDPSYDVLDGLPDDELPDLDRGRVLTLERLVQFALATADGPPGRGGRPVELHIETKHPTRYGGLVELRLVELLERYGLANPTARRSQVTVMSFAAGSLRRLQQLAPNLPAVYLMNRVPVRYRDGTLPGQATIAGPSLRILKAHPSYVRRVHDQGHRVHVWTVDEPADIDYVLDLGVDAVISNAPDRALRRRARV